MHKTCTDDHIFTVEWYDKTSINYFAVLQTWGPAQHLSMLTPGAVETPLGGLENQC